MDPVEISLVSDSSDNNDLSSDVSFADSTVTYESGEFHRNDGTDSPGAWTNEHGPPTPEETTDDENERLRHEEMILDALDVEVITQLTDDYCIICCQDYKIGEVIAWSSNPPCTLPTSIPLRSWKKFTMSQRILGCIMQPIRKSWKLMTILKIKSLLRRKRLCRRSSSLI